MQQDQNKVNDILIMKFVPHNKETAKNINEKVQNKR